jgi:hypothetical protein
MTQRDDLPPLERALPEERGTTKRCIGTLRVDRTE